MLAFAAYGCETAANMEKQIINYGHIMFPFIKCCQSKKKLNFRYFFLLGWCIWCGVNFK